MQEACPATESPAPENSSPRPSLTPIQRRIALAMLLGLHLFAATLCPAALADRNGDVYSLIWWSSILQFLTEENGRMGISLEIAFLAASFVTLFVLRCCGYRLARVIKPSTKKAKAQCLWTRLHILSAIRAVKRISPFPLLVAALLLAAVALCWPAWIISLANQEVAQDRAAEKEWGKWGATASVHCGEIMSLAFSGKKPVPQEFLDKLKKASIQAGWSNLSFSDSLLTDDQLGSIASGRTFWELTLTNTRITDAGLVHLQKMTSLRDLDLSGTAVADAGLKSLQGLKGLNSLDLSKTGITDAGLEHLKGLTQLTSLNLTGTKVTKEGKSKLQKNLPNLNYNRKNGRFLSIPENLIESSTPE